MPDPIGVRIDVLDTSSSEMVATGVDPEVRAAFLASQPSPPTVPGFDRGTRVRHKVSGEEAMVLRRYVVCGNPDHTRGPVTLCDATSPTCSPSVVNYEVSHGFGDWSQCYPEEIESVPAEPPA